VDAHEALRQALELVGADIAARRIEVQLDLPAAHHFLHADAVRLQQVFWNVIKNAVKFTPAGGIVSVRTSHPDGRQDVLAVEITDNGIGIEPEMLDRIFDTFAQEQHGSAHRFGGLGLGLAITRRLVELQNGRISAHSDGRGKGARFRIEMPVSALRPGVAAPPLPPAQTAPAAAPRRILLVEDHEMTRLTISRLLERRGHTVFAARNATEARAMAATINCDLVISDLGLPDCDGHTFMAGLRDAYGLPGLALSGYGAEEDVRRSRASGFYSHLTKPVHIRSLETAIAAAPPPQNGNSNGSGT
jgi:CheY-like chemotaxis protein